VQSPPSEARGHPASAPASGRDAPRDPGRRHVGASRSEPQLDRGDADKYRAEYSSDDEAATGTLQVRQRRGHLVLCGVVWCWVVVWRGRSQRTALTFGGVGDSKGAH